MRPAQFATLIAPYVMEQFGDKYMLKWIRKIAEALGNWAPAIAGLFVAGLGIALLLSFHIYRVSGLSWEEAITDFSQIFTLDNILLCILVLVLGAGLSIFARRR